MFFADSDVPQSITDVLLLPMLVLFFGAAVYAAGYFRGVQARSLPKFRWVGLVLILVAIYLGFMPFAQLSDPLYRGAVPGKRVLFGHYIAFFFPVVMALAVMVMEVLYRRKGREWE